jgi:hypothetical protein
MRRATRQRARQWRQRVYSCPEVALLLQHITGITKLKLTDDASFDIVCVSPPTLLNWICPQPQGLRAFFWGLAIAALFCPVLRQNKKIKKNQMLMK